MCNTMASMTIIILISIATIAAIIVEAVNIKSIDKAWDNTHIDILPETIFRQNLHMPTAPKHHVPDESSEFDSRPRVPPLKKLPNLTETEPTDSQNDAGQSNRREIDGKTIGEDGGSNSGASIASSSSPSNVNGEDANPVSVVNWILQHLKAEEMNPIREPSLENRIRRLASGEEISSNKNTTAADEQRFEHNMRVIRCALSLTYPETIPSPCIRFLYTTLLNAIY